MARTMKHNINNIVLSANEKIYNIGDLLKEQEAHKSDLEFVSALEDLQEIGKNKGIIYTPSEGETITFDPFEESVIVVRANEYDGRTIFQLNVLATSSEIGDVEVCIAMFRRKPGLEEDTKKLMKNKLNAMLLQNFIGDLKRLEILAGKKILIKKDERWPRQEFAKGKDGKTRQVDVSKLPEEARRPQSFYILEEVKE